MSLAYEVQFSNYFAKLNIKIEYQPTNKV